MEFKRPRKLSKNIEDRRGAGPQRGRGRMTAAGAGGAGGIAVIIGLLVAFCGGGGGGLPQLQSTQPDAAAIEAPLDPREDDQRRAAEVASVTLDSVQAYWAEVFAENGLQYQDATLVLFDTATPTACGQGSSATGPFYCSLDQNAYIDLTFWDQLERDFGAAGDFAQAYVIAHEIGHHVQNLLGISEDVRQLRQQNPRDSNALSVQQELQADCFAGAWSGVAFEDDDGTIILDENDIRDALDAAAAVGDDNIQERTTGRVDPHTWTHGSSQQRMDWFLRGFESGDPNNCNTFS